MRRIVWIVAVTVLVVLPGAAITTLVVRPALRQSVWPLVYAYRWWIPAAILAIAAAPEFVWELSLGIYLMVKGFKPAGVKRLQADRRAVPAPHAVPTP